MKVQMKVQVSGTRNGAGDWPPIGGQIEVPDDEARDLIASNMAVEVRAEPVIETATTDTTEEVEQATGLTTSNGPVKRGPGRPRKNP